MTKDTYHGGEADHASLPSSSLTSRLAKRRSVLMASGVLALVSGMLGGCGFSGSGKTADLAPEAAVTGINGFLWQASLDTLSFLPIANVDPKAAIILTDWYSLEEAPDERVKVSVRFLSQQLRSDGIRVAVVRQENKNGNWVTVPTQATTVLKIEEAILTRARQLRAERL